MALQNKNEKNSENSNNIGGSELDFQNYNLPDILNLFKISTNICEDDIINSRKKVLQLRNANVDPKIVTLFHKCNSVIQSIHKYRDSCYKHF